jgi:hypothetical protein
LYSVYVEVDVKIRPVEMSFALSEHVEDVSNGGMAKPGKDIVVQEKLLRSPS